MPTLSIVFDNGMERELFYLPLRGQDFPHRDRFRSRTRPWRGDNRRWEDDIIRSIAKHERRVAYAESTSDTMNNFFIQCAMRNEVVGPMVVCPALHGLTGMCSAG